VAALALSVGSGAFGAQAHYYARAFGAAGSAAGKLSLAPASIQAAGSGVAVSVQSHDVYVADTGNRRVDEFEAGGTFVRAFGWGVLDGEAKLETCTQISGCRAGLSGTGPGEFQTPVFVAVDNDPTSASYGDVYVGDTGDVLVTKFTAAGVLVGSWGNNGAGASANGQLNGSPSEFFHQSQSELTLEGVAVDGSANLTVVINGSSRMFEFAGSGSFTRSCKAAPFVAGTGLQGIAVDRFGDVYVVGGGAVEKVEADCNALGYVAVPTPGSEGAFGLAVDSESSDLYVDESGTLIEDIPLAGCVPGERGCVASQLFGEGALEGAAGLAVDPESGVVYAANTLAGKIAVFGVAIAATPAPPSEAKARSAVLNGTVNPEGAELSRCRFEYGEGESYDHSVPCEESPAAIGTGNSPVAVQAKVTGLVGGTSYEFRLRATNANGDVRSEGEPLVTLAVARVLEASSGEIREEVGGGGVSALLSAKVNPEGVAGTTCEIQYGISTGYGSTASCEPAAFSGNAATAVSVRLKGLSRASTYHWRVLVADENGVVEGPDQTFVYLPETPVQRGCGNETVRGESDMNPSTGRAFSLALPDCRAFEMVTPPFKDGALVNHGGFAVPWPSISGDGSRVMLKSIQCFDAPASCGAIRQTEGESFAFERTSTGWVTEPLAPSAASFAGSTRLAHNADTGLVLYALPAVAPALEQFYVRQRDSTLQAIGPLAEAPGPLGGYGPLAIVEVGNRLLLATSDFSHIIYESSGHDLWPSFDEAHGSGVSVYEYTGLGQPKPVLVGVTGGAGSTSLISRCGTEAGASSQSYGALSADGRTVYFTARACSTGTGANAGVAVPAAALYARIDASRTVAISGSAPEPRCDSVCQHQPPGDAAFAGASADGSRVFFTDTRQLMNGASEDSHTGDRAGEGCTFTASTASGCNLYEVECPNHCEDEAEKRLIDVSAPADSREAPRVQGVVALSSDGSHVYFVARGVLTEGVNSEGREPLEGAENLYVYERDGEHPGGQLRFVTMLSSADKEEIVNQLQFANVTPDGRFLVFTSHRGLTSDATHAEGSAQVYRYDAQSERLLRVSIGERGFNNNGNDTAGDARIAPAQEGREHNPSRADPTMSDDGSYVFFQSPAGLTPGALNDRPVTGNPHVLAENVYEWEAQGRGGCEQTEGCVSLISDGRDVTEGSRLPSAVRLVGVDATGENVFFETADQLVPGDTDTQTDVYDARVNGGFPAPVPSPPCEAGETPSGGVCRQVGSTPSVFAAPGSLVSSGPGNTVTETGATAGKPSRHGLTRTAELRRALAVCRGRYRARSAYGRRLVCERRARERYGPAGGRSKGGRGPGRGPKARRG
jgi:hypothetical protein